MLIVFVHLLHLQPRVSKPSVGWRPILPRDKRFEVVIWDMGQAFGDLGPGGGSPCVLAFEDRCVDITLYKDTRVGGEVPSGSSIRTFGASCVSTSRFDSDDPLFPRRSLLLTCSSLTRPYRCYLLLATLLHLSFSNCVSSFSKRVITRLGR